MRRGFSTGLFLGLLFLAACGDGTLADSLVDPPSSGGSQTTSGAVLTEPDLGAPPAISAAPSPSLDHVPRLVGVRYRSDPVDIAHPAFEYLDTTGSSLVRGAWYDGASGYMVINLSGTYYHYCEMPSSVWSSFRAASSFGSYYNASIKARYGCQGVVIPNY